MRFRLLLIVALLSLGFAAGAQEIHTLTTPATLTTTTYSLNYVGLDVANNRIRVELVSNTGALVSKVYDNSTTPTGATLLHTLNTANFSVNSLVKGIFIRLIADGVIPAGSVSGTPQ
jgi:hypothetical protein